MIKIKPWEKKKKVVKPQECIRYLTKKEKEKKVIYILKKLVINCVNYIYISI